MDLERLSPSRAAAAATRGASPPPMELDEVEDEEPAVAAPSLREQVWGPAAAAPPHPAGRARAPPRGLPQPAAAPHFDGSQQPAGAPPHAGFSQQQQPVGSGWHRPAALWAGPAEAGYPGMGPGVPAAQPMPGAMPPPIASRPLMSGPPMQQHYQQQPIMQPMHQAQPPHQAPPLVMYSSPQPQQAQHFPPQQQPLFVMSMAHHTMAGDPPAQQVLHGAASMPQVLYSQAPGPPHMLASAPPMQHPPPVAGQPSPGVGWQQQGPSGAHHMAPFPPFQQHQPQAWQQYR